MADTVDAMAVVGQKDVVSTVIPRLGHRYMLNIDVYDGREWFGVRLSAQI
jgi:hypothetical protein